MAYSVIVQSDVKQMDTCVHAAYFNFMTVGTYP